MALNLPQVRRRWQALVSVASTGVAAATAIFRPPPVGDAPGLLALGGLLAAVSAGLIYVAMVKYSTARYLRWWMAAALVGIVGALGSHYAYARWWDGNVARYLGQDYVVGDEFTADGQAWVARQGVTNPTELLFDAGGVPERIWTTSSIARVKAWMRVTYYLGFPITVLAIMATVQAVHCATRKPRRRSKPKSRVKPPDLSRA